MNALAKLSMLKTHQDDFVLCFQRHSFSP